MCVPSPASADQSDAIRQLERRLEAQEARIRELEAALAARPNQAFPAATESTTSAEAGVPTRGKLPIIVGGDIRLRYEINTGERGARD